MSAMSQPVQALSLDLLGLRTFAATCPSLRSSGRLVARVADRQSARLALRPADEE